MKNNKHLKPNLDEPASRFFLAGKPEPKRTVEGTYALWVECGCLSPGCQLVVRLKALHSSTCIRCKFLPPIPNLAKNWQNSIGKVHKILSNKKNVSSALVHEERNISFVSGRDFIGLITAVKTAATRKFIHMNFVSTDATRDTAKIIFSRWKSEMNQKVLCAFAPLKEKILSSDLRSINLSIICSLLIFLASCTDKNETKNGQSTDPTVTETFSERLTEVDTSILHPSTFYKEVISQGKVASVRKIEVPFTAQGVITEVSVKDGQYVEKGDLLVAIDDFTIRNEMNKLQTQLDQARLNIENHYINLGYHPNETADIPEEVKRNSAIEFNLESIDIEHERLEHELASRHITAPFSGTITDLQVNEGAHTTAYEKVCTLVDNRHLKIVFPVLESEMIRVQKGQSIQIQPIFQTTEKLSGFGQITTISPIVTDQGMIECVAQIGKGNIPYRDGMRVNVYIRDAILNVLVLPKTAVVDRQNRLVVFTLSKDNRAYWNYVELGGENSDSYLIRDGLEAGDTIIMNNNFDLAHLEKIKIND